MASEKSEFDSLVSALRNISERLGSMQEGSAALIKRDLDKALRFVPEPAPEPLLAPVSTQQPALASAAVESIGDIVRREIQAAMRGFAAGNVPPSGEQV